MLVNFLIFCQCQSSEYKYTKIYINYSKYNQMMKAHRLGLLYHTLTFIYLSFLHVYFVVNLIFTSILAWHSVFFDLPLLLFLLFTLLKPLWWHTVAAWTFFSYEATTLNKYPPTNFFTLNTLLFNHFWCRLKHSGMWINLPTVHFTEIRKKKIIPPAKKLWRAYFCTTKS